MWHQLSSDNHFLGCWVCRLKKVNLFFGFSFFGNYVYAPAAFQWHTFFHIFSAVKCQASQHHLPGNHGTRTRTHLKCPESAAASSLCKFVEDRIPWLSWTIFSGHRIALCLQASVRRRSIGFQPVRHEWASGLQPEPIPDLQIYGIFSSIFIAIDSSFGLELKQC